MQRRNFLKSAFAGTTAVMAGIPFLNGKSAPKLKIKKIRYYAAPGYTKPLFNQSHGIVEIETDGGITGIGEGGFKDVIEQCARMIIGEDPFRIEHIWQDLYRGMFYPPGREKLLAVGALDMALWDIKGKALGVPVYELLGGATREYVECYATGFAASKAKTEEDRARDCIAAGLRAYRIGPTGGSGEAPYEFYENVKKTIDFCKRIDAAVGGGGNWAVDLHTRFDLTDGLKICKALENLEPYFVEDIVRSENQELYQKVRQMTTVPIAVGEQFGDKWDTNYLIEQHLYDYCRVTIPNCGGISEFKKLASMCETHYVGMVPHFTGPLSTAALVHVLGSSSPARALMELGGGAPEKVAYYNEDLFNFKNGKFYLNPSPGLGVKFDSKKATLVMEIDSKTPYPHPFLKSPDGSYHNW